MTDQLDRSDLASMTPEQIDEAHKKGQFDVLLGGVSTEDAELRQLARDGLPITRTDLRRLTQLGEHELIANLDLANIRD